jgi:hypothetical protein
MNYGSEIEFHHVANHAQPAHEPRSCDVCKSTTFEAVLRSPLTPDTAKNTIGRIMLHCWPLRKKRKLAAKVSQASDQMEQATGSYLHLVCQGGR